MGDQKTTENKKDIPLIESPSMRGFGGGAASSARWVKAGHNERAKKENNAANRIEHKGGRQEKDKILGWLESESTLVKKNTPVGLLMSNPILTKAEWVRTEEKKEWNLPPKVLGRLSGKGING